MPDIPGVLHTEKPLLWLVIGLSVVMLFTLQAVETAVEGAWPHERRPARLLPRERTAQTFWGVVALLVLPGALLTILNLGVIVWRDVPRPETLSLGSLLVGLGWGIFLLASDDRLKVRRYLTSIGPTAPLALLAVLLVGDVLLLMAFLEIRPSLETIKEALPLVLRLHR
jgi:formate hydrogenlyase subunit 3/multisubunit Na+/H+ antiporter MnhD subunit